MLECIFHEKNVGACPLIQWLGIVVTSMLACVIAGAQPSPSPSKPTLSSILRDHTLWGRDFPLALASLQSSQEVDLHGVVIFPTRIVGGTRFKTREDAEQTSRRLTEAIATSELKPKPDFQAMFREIRPQAAAPLKAEIIPAFADDDSIRVAWTRPDAEFLPPKLTVAAVQERLGPPEKVVTQVIQSEGERRPVVLTLYRYADGSVSFAESDIAARPGLVDRVLLDAPALINTLFE